MIELRNRRIKMSQKTLKERHSQLKPIMKYLYFQKHPEQSSLINTPDNPKEIKKNQLRLMKIRILYL